MDQRRTSKNKTTTLSCNSQTKRLTLAGCCHSSVVAVVTIILTASLFLAKQHQNKIAAVVQVQAFPQKILSFRPRRSGGPHQQQQTRHHHHNKCRCPNVAVAFASSAGPSASTTRIESSDDDNDVMAEEQMRWDRLYEQGQTGRCVSNRIGTIHCRMLIRLVASVLSGCDSLILNRLKVHCRS